MIGKSFNAYIDKRRRLARSDTAPSINTYNTLTANQIPQLFHCAAAKSEIELLNQAPLVAHDSSEFVDQKYFFRKLRRCSPPSNIKYRIRHKSPAESEYYRKLSDTRVIKSKRSNSIDPDQQLTICALMSEVAIMKLSRSLSKRMPRSGSAKNLMDLRDDYNVTGNDNKFIAKEISALFASIENNDVKSVETLLNTNPRIVNTYNNIDFTPLDIAMLYNYSTVAKRLIECGGLNNECFDNDPRILQNRLHSLSKTYTVQLLEFPNNVDYIESLNNQLKLFKSNLEAMKPGSMPRKVTLETAGLYSLMVTVYPPSDSIVTRYRIEWSRRSDFCEIDDEIIVRTKFPVGVYQISDLIPHVAYFVRVSSINLKGVGPSRASVPSSAEPSCWTESVCVLPSSTGIRRCLHKQELCPSVQFDDEEARLEQQLQVWLVTIKCRGALSQNSSASTVSSHESGEQKRHYTPNTTRKSLLKALFQSSSKFIRQPKHGLYIALVYKAVDNDKLLTCGEEQLPFVLVDDDNPSISLVNAECIWLMRLLANQSDLRLIVDVLSRLQLPASVQLRVKLLIAVCQLQETLENRDLGLLYPCVVQDTNYNVIVLTKQIPVAKELSLPTGIKWSPLSKLSKTSGSINDSVSSQTGLEEELYSKIETFISFFRRNNTSLDDGLYLGYVRFKSTLDQLYIQQNIFSPTIFPVVKVRDNWHVSKEEWDHFVSLTVTHLSHLQNEKGSKLQSIVVKAWQKLQINLKLKPSDSESCRLYLEEILWLKQRVSVILIVPSVNDFCGLPGQEIDLPLDYEWVSLHAFEYYHFLSHLKVENQFATWASLNSSIEVLLPVAQHCLRQGFDQQEILQCKERVDQFQWIQVNLEQYWKELRWSVDVINNCRDKQVSNLLTIPIQIVIETDALAKPVLYTEIHCPDSTETFSKPRRSFDISFGASNEVTPTNFPSMSVSENLHISAKHNSFGESAPCNNGTTEVKEGLIPVTDVKPGKRSPVKGTIRVYAGYPCGLLEGTSVKLLLNSQTTSSDVVKLIVSQLNTISMARNPQAPQYTGNDLFKFCLMVTIDRMSRPLPDNFHPLLLKQPWKSGRLTVKLKSQLQTVPAC